MTALTSWTEMSHKEQLERLDERLKDPKKMWKYNAGDFKESKLWDKYMHCYEDVFTHCNEIPWHIIPADQKWFRNLAISQIVADKMESLNLRYPKPAFDPRKVKVV